MIRGGLMGYHAYTLASGGVLDVAFSPDGKLVYTSTSSGHVIAYDVATRHVLSDWNLHGTVGAISLSGDGAYLLGVKTYDDHHRSLLYRIDTATGKTTYFSAPGSDLLDIQVVNSHQALLSGGTEGTLRTVDFLTGTFGSVQGAWFYDSVDLNRDGRYTLIAEKNDSSGPLAIYDGAKNAIVATGDDYQPGATGGFNWGIQAISQHGKLVAQAVAQGTINIYDLGLHAKHSFTLEGALGGVASGLAFDRTGDHLFVLYPNDLLQEYRTSDWTVIKTFQVSDIGSDYYSETYGDALLVSPDGKHLTIFGNDTGTITLVDLTKGHSAGLSPEFGTAPGMAFRSAADHADLTIHAGAGDLHYMHQAIA